MQQGLWVSSHNDRCTIYKRIDENSPYSLYRRHHLHTRHKYWCWEASRQRFHCTHKRQRGRNSCTLQSDQQYTYLSVQTDAHHNKELNDRSPSKLVTLVACLSWHKSRWAYWLDVLEPVEYELFIHCYESPVSVTGNGHKHVSGWQLQSVSHMVH